MMATVRLNDAGMKRARDLIASGDVMKKGAWAFSAEESAAILGDPPDWERYGSSHLGIRTGTSRKTKQAYVYPYGKESKIFRSALVAARQRAAQQGHSAVFNAAGKLLQEIDGTAEMSRSVVENMKTIGAFAAEPVPVEWDELPELVIQLLPYTGDDTITLVDGRQLKVSDRSIQSVADKFNARENPLVLDYDHGTFNPFLEMGSLAAGWIQEIWPVASDANISELADERVRAAAETYGPGIYAVIHLTEKSTQHVRAREYQFVSPVVVQNDDFEVLELLGAGLTNDPAIDGMMPIAAKRDCSGSMESARGDATSGAASEGSNDPTPETTGETDMDLDKISAIVGKRVESEAQALELLSAMKARSDAAEENATKVAELEAERLDREATETVAAAIADGRLAEAQKDWALSLFKSDRQAWNSYVKATEPGTFSQEKKLPPQDRLTDNTDDDDSTIDFPENVKFFGQTINVNKEQLAALNKACQLSRDKFNGDLARAIRAVRR